MREEPNTCQMTMGDDGRINGIEIYWKCGRPAKRWIPDQYNRVGYNGRMLLCGLHARAHDRVAVRVGRKLSEPLL